MMERRYSSLILTDHSSHSSHDSIFKIAQYINSDKRSKRTIVASRNSSLNAAFFSAGQETELWGKDVDSDFCHEKISSWFDSIVKVDITEFDVIFLRIDHPVPKNFLKWIKIKAANSIFINDPFGIIETSSKEYLLRFSEITPWMKICTTINDVNQIAETRSIVIKPLKGYGGQGILKIEQGVHYIGNTPVSKKVAEAQIRRELATNGKVLINEYLVNVSMGDKRILMVNGKVVGSFLRLPKKGSWVCNLNQGGKARPEVPDPEELEMASILSKELSHHGIVMFGFDTLMGNGKRLLTEINTTNVGGFIQAEEGGKGMSVSSVVNLLWEHIEKNA